MNWYKQSQQSLKELYDEAMSYWDISTKNMSEEEREAFYAKIKETDDRLRSKYKEYPDFEEKIRSGKGHEVSPMHFLDYHQTGSINMDAYDNYEKEGGLSWIGDTERYSEIVHKEKYGDETIEFRKESPSEENRLKYVKKDADGEILRDEKGLAILLSPEETKEKGYPMYPTSIAAFNEAGQPIGFASDEWGTDGIWVEGPYQKKGIGTELLYLFRQQFNPERRIGQMTPQGQRMTKSYHKKLVQEALRRGEEVPEHVIDFYRDKI